MLTRVATGLMMSCADGQANHNVMRLQAPPTPIVLDYEPPSTGHRYRRLLRPFRICAFVYLLGGGSYMAVSFRGWSPGSCLPAMFLVTCLLVALPGCIVFLGVPWRRYLAITATLVVLPALVADGYGTLEEKLFVAGARALPPTTPTVFKARWWPNENCYLCYEPATGELGGGD